MFTICYCKKPLEKSFAQIVIFRQIDGIFAQIKFFVKLMDFSSNHHQFDEFFRQIDGNLSILSCKGFYPMGLCKGFSKAFCPMEEKALQQASIIVVFYLANPYKNTTARSLFVQ